MTNMSRFPLLYLEFLHIPSEGRSTSLPSFAFALSTYNKYPLCRTVNLLTIKLRLAVSSEKDK